MGWLPTRRNRRVFVSWWKYTSRPDSFARAIDAHNYFFAQGAGLSVFKYFPRAWCCFWTLVRERPQFVIASNPPVLAPLVAWVYCTLFNARFCMDSHTSAFDRPRWERLMWLTAFLGRRAVWSVTTNEALSDRLERRGVHGVVIEDIPFEMPETSYPVESRHFCVAVVCSFDVDEPIAEIVEAARMAPEVQFYLTGNPKKVPAPIVDRKPENLTFTGFLSNADYAGLLRSVNSVVVLTSHDFTMQRGGSEAITVKKPLVTSDFPVLRHVFYKGTEFTDNSPADIVRAIRAVHADEGRFRREMREMYAERDARWERQHADLERLFASAN